MSAVPPDSATGAARLLADAAAGEQAARQRLDAAIADLALPGPSRLSDYQRAAIGRMAEQLVARIGASLSERVAAATGGATADALSTLRALPRLERAGLLRDPELVALLLRRATEHRLAQRLRRDRSDGLLDTLLVHEDAAVAQAAVALLVAEGRRYDMFQDAALPDADLPAELQHRLVWVVAAALRGALLDRDARDGETIDRLVAGAAQALLRGYDEARTLDGCALALVRALDRVGRLEDDAVAALAEDGHVSTTVAALAHRAGIDPAGAWDMALDPAGSRLALLLRAGDVGQAGAARVLTAWLPHVRDAGEIVEDLDGIDATAARAATRLWRLDPAFRAAILALG